MKTKIFALILSCLAVTAYGEKVITIHNPAFEFTNSGIYEVSKIELSDTETKLFIHSIFIPKWWVMYSDKDCIYLHETGDTLYPTDIIGTEFGKKLWMPASGDSTIVMVYPPINKKVKTIDWFTLDDNQNIFGISLDPKQKHEKKDHNIPDKVQQWIDKELSAYKDREPMDIINGNVFNEGEARLIGYIKGYDKRAGFKTGIIYLNNVFTREDYPTVVEIQADGRFELSFNLFHPIKTSVLINRLWLKFYAEPNQITCMILDWDEFMMADRKRNIRYQFNDIEYLGPLAKINHDLFSFPSIDWNYNKAMNKVKTLTPEAYIDFENEWKNKSLQALENYHLEHNISPNAYQILENEIFLEHGTNLMDYPSRKSNEAKKDTTNKNLLTPLPEDYYNLVNNLPLNNPSVVINNKYNSFINRFEYLPPFTKNRYRQLSKQTNSYELLKDNNAELTEEEENLLKILYKENKTEKEAELLKNNKDKINSTLSRYQPVFQKYRDMQSAQNINKEWAVRDSIIDNLVTVNCQFSKDIIKVRTLNFNCKRFESDVANVMWTNLKQSLQHPEAIKQGDQLLTNLFALKEQGSYELPTGKGTDIFKKIIAPHKGKVLFVDFWATSCGPCVYGINRMKETRKEYENNQNFDFIFITDQSSSREPQYSEFVKEQDLKNTYRLTKDEFVYLRELFKFNGIPRYVLIGKNGEVLNDDFAMHNFKYELKKLFPDI